MLKLKYIIILIAFLHSCKANQHKTIEVHSKKDSCKSYYDTLLKADVYTEITELTNFLKGLPKFNSFLMKNVMVKEQEYIQASFNVTIIWDERGKIRHQEISNKKNDLTEQEKEILRVISISPDWEPAKCNGKAVPFKLTIPIRWNRSK